jgi:hypothetical protein
MPPINRLQPIAQKLSFSVTSALWAPAVAEPKRYIYTTKVLNTGAFKQFQIVSFPALTVPVLLSAINLDN